MECYSTNNEDWHEDIESVYDVFEEDCQVGEKVEYWAADSEAVAHSDFACADLLIESMQERAFDDFGEFAETYLDDLSKEKIDELEKLLVNFFDEHAKPPTFYSVGNVRKVEGWWDGEEVVFTPMMTAQEAENVLS